MEVTEETVQTTKKSLEDNGFSLIACRPVEWTPEEEAAMRSAGIPTGIYPGSTKDHCGLCGREVWIGPKSTALREAVNDERLLPACLTCAVKTMQALPGEVHNLGNTDIPQ